MGRIGVAQLSASPLQGTVTDPSGSAISGASVAISSSESKLERSLGTGGQGGYKFVALPPGIYTLTVTAKGFTRYQQTSLQHLGNPPATANGPLQLGSATWTVAVTREA